MSHDDDRNPVISDLRDTLRKIADAFGDRQTTRANRGDARLPGAPFITVTVDTEHRTYTGRMFDIWTSGEVLDLYDTSVIDPYAEQANPAHSIRSSTIVAARVQEQHAFQPVEFPMSRTEFDAAVDSFINTAATILTDPAAYDDLDDYQPTVTDMLADLMRQTEPIAVTSEQCEALRKAADPINPIMFNSTLISQWETVARAIATTSGVNTGPRLGHGTRPEIRTILPAQDANEALNIVIHNTDDPKPGPTTLLKFLTHGVPTAYLYPETHQRALDDYRMQALDHARTSGTARATYADDATNLVPLP